MEVKLEKRYPLDVDPARAWAVLSDVTATAACMPGAAITEAIDATHYKGNVKVKVGPANAAFAGTIEVLAVDAAAMTLQLLGKGTDRGGSSASMNLTSRIEAGETADTSVLYGDAAVTINGKFAQFGGRMMVPVAELLLAQFAENFKASAAAKTASGTPPIAAKTDNVPVEADHIPPGLNSPTVEMDKPEGAVQPAASVAPAGRQREINGLALVWSLVKNWLAGLFGKPH